MAPGVNGVFNIGSGTRIGIKDLVERLRAASVLNPVVRHVPPRAGDVCDNPAGSSTAQKAFGCDPAVTMDEGLPEYVGWTRTQVA